MKIKYLRMKYELSQSDLSEYLDMDQKTYHNIENNFTRRFRKDTLIKLAYLYDVSLDYLLGITDEKKCFPKDKRKKIIKEYNINLYLVKKLRTERCFAHKSTLL